MISSYILWAIKMFETIMGVLGSSGFGVITGLVGSFLAKREERLSMALRFKHENTMMQYELQRDVQDHAHDLDMADKNMEMAETEGQIATDVAEMGNIHETIQAQAKASGIGWLDGILRFVRPVITFYLLVILTIIGFKLHTLVGGLDKLPIAEVFSLYKHIIYQTVFLAVTAVAWWFGSRGGNMKVPKI